MAPFIKLHNEKNCQEGTVTEVPCHYCSLKYSI
jgi:hypothetical protein